MTGPVPADLHADVDELMARLLAAADGGQWLDAFLLAAGIVQVVDDLLQGTSWPPRRLVKHLDGAAGGRISGTTLRSAGQVLDATTEAFLAVPPVRGLHAWSRGMSEITDALAGLVVGAAVENGAAEKDTAEKSAAEHRAQEEAVRRSVHRAGGLLTEAPAGARLLGDSLLRPPASFCSFDQHPQDLVELARRFATEHPDRERPLLVVGVRTSGSYLAPLVGAALRQLGHRRVAVGTTRPGLALLPGRAAVAREVLRRGGMVLVVDDPPASGGSLAAVAARAERDGFPADAVVPLFATFDDGATLPPVLDRYRSVVLPGPAWHVHGRLRADALRSLLPGMLASGQEVTGIEVGEPSRLSRKAHLAVPVTVQVESPSAGRRSLPMVAQWSGVGYLGRHAVTLATTLTDLVPKVYGFADGVLLRERLPGEDGGAADAGVGAPGVAAPSVETMEVARYVAARQERFAVPEDRSLRLAGREPVWEVAARVLAPVFGRAHVVLRPALVHPLVKSLLTAEQPCLVDGRTAPERWVADAAGGWAKTDFAEGAFSNLNLASYDAAYDLAGAADLADGGIGGEEQLLADYRKLTGRRISAARWCLLRVVQARNLSRPADVRRAQARAVQRFLAGAFLADLESDPQGPWCVLDVDGVLESDVMGFPASSPQGMLVLRALRAHGYRTMVATGRSLPEVQDRCAAYRLAGGVAEYGAVCFDAATGTTQVVLPPEREQADDGGLRARLSELPSVRVDPLSRWCVRASVQDGTRRTGLPARTVAALLDEHQFGALFDVVPGDAQTDFVPRGVDKVGGVRALLGQFGDDSSAPLLAVGDGVADIALLRWARHGAAPGNAAAEVVAAGVPVARRSYQAGLAQVVGQLIGHRPGGCPLCRPPRHSPGTRALLALLAVPEAGRAGLPARIARLASADLALVRTAPAARGDGEPAP
ncbi:hydroxymethylpyrimidine pyrophosphatase-like HAD family hydrolase [Streptacidiphilus sp. MAP12-16]|uniref:HAD family hydrolase n=1 Tax=Streptacidiphilus sp. MAP12-16 TaxID=3156300 RepID=UPI0035122036